MDGVHDLGGRQGFGPVVVEADEPPFHDAWEPTARAVTFATVAHVPNPSTSKFRHAIERMEPGHYLTSSYYEHWLTAAATLAVEAGLVTREELEERTGGPFPLAGQVRAGDIHVSALPRARFQVGDAVRVRNIHPSGHTRCPGYVRGKVGMVARLDGEWSIPDVEAHTPDRVSEETYSVRFSADELWGDGQTGVSVNVDLWDSYLEPA
ncbi:MAG: nitrile hydratase subunit beta [Acidimicrobiia bacterium]|nr:nitrile hydratase subunit beta [Acidimicrobiia bacterium]